MSEQIQKQAETIQAQVAAFAAERVEDNRDSGYIFRNLGEIAASGVEDLSRVLSDAEYHKNEAGKQVRVAEGTNRSVATTEEYTDFLRTVGGAKYEGIAVRADILGAYHDYEPIVASLKNELEDPTTRKQHPNFLGTGSNAMAFSIEKDDKKYAVRVPRARGTSPAAIDSHLAGAVLGKGVPHLEQIVAASYKDGVTVAEMMPGKEMGNLTVEDIANITDEQLGELVDTLVVVRERGIEIDPKPSNLFYDSKHGFGLVDYHSSKVAGKGSADQELGQIVGWMATGLENAGRYGKPYITEKSAEDYEVDVAYAKANNKVLQRYRNIVEKKLAGSDRDEALRHIDHIRESIQDTVSNPDWVTERLAQDADWKKRREEAVNQPSKDGWDFV